MLPSLCSWPRGAHESASLLLLILSTSNRALVFLTIKNKIQLISSRANELSREYIYTIKASNFSHAMKIIYKKNRENRDHRMTASDFEIKAVSLVRYYCLLAISFSSRNLSRSRRANEERNMRKIPCKIGPKMRNKKRERGDERGEGNIHQHSITLNCKMTTA